MKNNSNTKPITDLRNTNEISKQCHDLNEPIFITKNGYDDLVIMASDTYKEIVKANQIQLPKTSSYHNMVRVACATNEIKVANPSFNVKEICKIIDSIKNEDIDILVFPELSLTGYTCGDLFYQHTLLNETLKALNELVQYTKNINTLLFVGAPLLFQYKLYNCAIAISNGKILGVVPKSNLPNYNEFYEARQFNEWHNENSEIEINGILYPFGTKLLFSNLYLRNLKVACEICEDLWAAKTPSTNHALAGANIIVNLSASNELFGKDKIRKILVQSTSSRLACAYVYASSGNGESTQDLVYSSHNIIAENGVILKESKTFENELIISDIDLDILISTRCKNSSFRNINASSYKTIYFEKEIAKRNLKRFINPYPFLPLEDEKKEYVEGTITLQVMGLAKRLKHINCKNVVLGLSGGLDSTLALIVCYETFKYLKLDTKGIHCLTMPCFGTSSRTYNNALKLSSLFNTSLKEIRINEAVKIHLNDIGHDLKTDDVTFENAQARERTQILFDYANKINGIVIGTGDLSELALGWCTFNGDHMANYCLNSSISKTLVKYLVKEYANNNKKVKDVLDDVLDTPISPELKINQNDNINQKTEDTIGPYDLHDFFLYYLLKYNFSINKIYYYAINAFKGKFNEKEIKKWLNLFVKRFFTQQFKRSTIPDGPKVSEISLSPRGDLRMPSDASYIDFLLDN